MKMPFVYLFCYLTRQPHDNPFFSFSHTISHTPFLYGCSTAAILKRQNQRWARVLEHICGLDGGKTITQE